MKPVMYPQSPYQITKSRHLWSQAGHALKRGRLHRAPGDKRDEHTTKSLDPKT